MLKRRSFVLLLAGLLYFSILPVQSQEVPQLSIFPHKIDFEATEGNSNFGVFADLERIGEYSFQIVDFRLVEGDLVLRFKVPGISSIEHIEHVNFDLQIIRSDGRRYCASEEDLYGDFTNLMNAPFQEHEIRWAGILERVRPFRGQYKLITWVSVYGKKQLLCEESVRPTFNMRKWTPHLIATGAAFGLFGSGLLVKSDANKQYQDNLVDPQREPTSLIFEDYQKKNRTSQTLKVAGIGLFAANAIWVLIRQQKIRKKQNYYDEVCDRDSQQLTVYPRFRVAEDALAGSPSIGLQVNWKLAH